MDKVAGLSPSQRAELFRQSAERRGLRDAIVEKDFWVCWVLKKLFSDKTLQNRLVFKGGTSLSKVYKLIDRFSEDVDLVLDWRLIGYGSDGEDPELPQPSKSKQDRFNVQMNAKAAEYIGGPLLLHLSAIFSSVSEIEVAVDPNDPHCVDVRYPAVFKAGYLLPQVRLEIGPLASWVPSAPYSIQPYASEDFPQVFEDPVCPVTAIAAERTFWEKTTILHKEAHRASAIPARYSRHYYDLFKLAESPIRAEALADIKLLEAVVAFKSQFYPSAWARYDLASPGTFRLLPKQDQVGMLEKDYREMAAMLFGDIPDFKAILQVLSALESEINQLK